MARLGIIRLTISYPSFFWKKGLRKGSVRVGIKIIDPPKKYEEFVKTLS
jgi:hypothetical protein